MILWHAGPSKATARVAVTNTVGPRVLICRDDSCTRCQATLTGWDRSFHRYHRQACHTGHHDTAHCRREEQACAGSVQAR